MGIAHALVALISLIFFGASIWVLIYAFKK